MGKHARNTKQYTVRNVPLPVDRALKQMASQKNTSLNKLLILSLEKFTGVTSSGSSDLAKFAGKIPLEPEVKKALKDQRRVFDKEWL